MVTAACGIKDGQSNYLAYCLLGDLKALGGCPRIAIFSQIEANSKKLPEAYT
jgi:hypothetical protein